MSEGPVERFVAAKQQGDGAAAVACFAPDAVVHDDGRTHVGTEAIAAWLHDVSTAFALTYDLVQVDRDGSSVVALVAVSGNFPGSPITFRYDAEVADDRIARLAIAPA